MTIHVSHSAFQTLISGKLVPPSTMERLQEGIDYLVDNGFMTDAHIRPSTRDACIDWVNAAVNILSQISAPPTQRVPGFTVPQWPSFAELEAAMVRDAAAQVKRKDAAIGPQICTKCKFKNDYAGKEHLSADGSYTCRSCK